MFTRNEKDVAEALSQEFARFFEDFVDRECYPQNLVVSRKTAVFAIVNAFVGKVEGRKEADDFAEPLLGKLLGTV